MWEWLELGSENKLEEFEEHDGKHGTTSLNRLLTEMWMLSELLVRAQKKVRNMVEKTYIILENT